MHAVYAEADLGHHKKGAPQNDKKIFLQHGDKPEILK